MADYYTYFSFTISLNQPELQQALDLFHQLHAVHEGEVAPDLPPALKEFAGDCCFEAEALSHQLWIHSECGGVDAVCAFVQHLVKQYNLEPVSFEWSHDCSKPRTDAYGGGAAYITNKEIRTMNTAEWINQQTKPT